MPRPPEGGTTIFVLGLLSLIGCGIFTGIPAWLMGNSYLARCRSIGAEPDGLANAGRIMGMVSVALMALGLLAVVVAVAFGLVAGVAAQ